MRFNIIYIILLFVCIITACSTEDKNGVINKLNIIHSTLYKYDSLNFSMLKSIELDETIFARKGTKIFLKEPDNNITRHFSFKFNNNHNNFDSFKISITDWKSNKYKLESLNSYDGRYPLLCKGDTLFYIKDNNLYFSKSGQIEHCCEFKLRSRIYNEMISEDGYYAIRMEGLILVSTNLKEWNKVYNYKRFISKSMAFVNNPKDNSKELIFSEYTPGAERSRHHILKYNFSRKQLKNIMIFHKSDEGKYPFARHIHILEKDPYTGDIWVGTGDTDSESSIYRSTDQGQTFQIVGSGSQRWRTLAFIFTPTHVFWNMDTHEPQYMLRVDRNDLSSAPVDETRIKQFSIINSACWSIEQLKAPNGEPIWIMSSNNEGGFYDDYSRTYGIIIKDCVPEFHDLFAIKAKTKYTQLMPVGINDNNEIILYDHEQKKLNNYTITNK